MGEYKLPGFRRPLYPSRHLISLTKEPEYDEFPVIEMGPYGYSNAWTFMGKPRDIPQEVYEEQARFLWKHCGGK